MSETAYDDVNNEARADWHRDRPAPDRDGTADEIPVDIGARRAAAIDPWIEGQIDCERCDERRDPWCAHGSALCINCALTGCQVCATEDADARARADAIYEEYWDR